MYPSVTRREFLKTIGVAGAAACSGLAAWRLGAPWQPKRRKPRPTPPSLGGVWAVAPIVSGV